jgi:anti-anti-sigma factor
VTRDKDTYPVRWTGGQAIVTLPEQIDVSNAGQIREELLAVINRGAAALIPDMTATLSCDHAGADAVVRAYQRALVSGTQLRLVVTAPIVQRVLGINGLDRLIPIYPTLEAAIAGGTPAPVPPAAPRAADPLNQPGTAAITMAVLEELIDALADGVAVTDDAGTLALANRRLEEMFGYEHTELIGQPVESLIPAGLRAAHRSHRAAYARAPEARPMGAGARLVGLRKDGATFPVEISLSPVPTTTGLFTLAVVRDITQTLQREDPTNIARTAATAEQVRHDQELLHRTTHRPSQSASSRATPDGLPSDLAKQRPHADQIWTASMLTAPDKSKAGRSYRSSAYVNKPGRAGTSRKTRSPGGARI